jgi:hypothetical protein
MVVGSSLTDAAVAARVELHDEHERRETAPAEAAGENGH